MSLTIHLAAPQEFLQKTLLYARQHETYCLLDGNTPLFEHYPFAPFRTKIGLGVRQYLNTWEELEAWLANPTALELLGFISYDAKNQLELLHSQHLDHLAVPDICFFEPQYLLQFDNNQLLISGEGNLEALYVAIDEQVLANFPTDISTRPIHIQNRFTQETYIDTVKQIQQYIYEGEVYELNYCMEFFAENVCLNPLATYWALKTISPMPFASFLKINDLYVIGASPERFMKKTGVQLVSQPIKGTIRRGNNANEDEILKQRLRYSEKEIAENMMIVDLVRNDFARSAEVGTVKVPEIFGIYTFPQVHQMISTVTATVSPTVSPLEVIKNAFPMGSMTGAPKIRAMQLIEAVERSRRGIFSGTIGCLTAQGDFDLNVVIRSIFYRPSTGYLSFQAGSAITYDAQPEQEYAECWLKTLAIRKALGLVI